MHDRLKTYAALLLDEGSHWIGESPLHVTLGQPLELDTIQLQQFINLLKVDLHEFGPIELVARDNASLGEHREIRARLVGRSAELLYLHELVLGATMEIVPEMVITYPDFTPHASYKKSGRGLQPHERRTVDNVVVLQKPDPTSWRRVSTIQLTTDR